MKVSCCCLNVLSGALRLVHDAQVVEHIGCPFPSLCLELPGKERAVPAHGMSFYPVVCKERPAESVCSSCPVRKVASLSCPYAIALVPMLPGPYLSLRLAFRLPDSYNDGRHRADRGVICVLSGRLAHRLMPEMTGERVLTGRQQSRLTTVRQLEHPSSPQNPHQQSAPPGMAACRGIKVKVIC